MTVNSCWKKPPIGDTSQWLYCITWSM